MELFNKLNYIFISVSLEARREDKKIQNRTAAVFPGTQLLYLFYNVNLTCYCLSQMFDLCRIWKYLLVTDVYTEMMS
jgi:hypothetical protein